MMTTQGRIGTSSKLFKLKQWLTVSQAAQYLALVFGEDVTEADVLQLGLGGHLKLSVRFVNHAKAKLARPENTAAELIALHKHFEQTLAEHSAARVAGLPSPKRSKRTLTPDEEKFERLVFLEDPVYDLPMIGAERLDVEHEYQRQTAGPAVTLINLGGTFVDSLDGTRFHLQERLSKEITVADLPMKVGEYYYPAGGLPEDAVLVVRTAALAELAERVAGDPKQVDAQLGQRERATLLTMIAALAKEAKIDLSKLSKAGATIEALTTALGARVSARAAEDHLKRIPDALERRGKASA